MNANLEERFKRLERRYFVMQTLVILAIVVLLVSGLSSGEEAQVVRCKKLEVLDENGNLLAYIGTDADGSRGLFIHDDKSRLRVATIHDASQSAFYAFDSTGTIRVGLAQFAHGGGGVALHGEQSKGGAVLYYKNGGSLSLFDKEGNTTHRFPPKD